MIVVDWVYQLPAGRNAKFLTSVNGFVNALIGGWQLSGILRATSGLPFSVFDPGWTTDWEQNGNGVVSGKVKTHLHFDQNGSPQFFENASAINQGLSAGGPIRFSYPGKNGQRNNFRGEGIFDLDSGLAKVWRIGDYGNLKFTWEVYNVTNTNRFDVPSNQQIQLSSGTLGVSNTLLSAPRRMQFSLPFDF